MKSIWSEFTKEISHVDDCFPCQENKMEVQNVSILTLIVKPKEWISTRGPSYHSRGNKILKSSAWIIFKIEAHENRGGEFKFLMWKFSFDLIRGNIFSIK